MTIRIERLTGGRDFYVDQLTAEAAQVAFSTTYPFVAYSALVFLNGVLQKKGTSYNEDGDLEGITFEADVVEEGDEVEVRYAKS